MSAPAGTRRLLLSLLGWLLAAPAAAQPLLTDTLVLRAAQAQAERWLDQGHDQPDQVLALLQAPPAAPAGLPEPVWQRLVLRSQALVAARAGRAALADNLGDKLRRWTGPEQGAAQVDAQIVSALQAEQQWLPETAEPLGAQADEALRRLCEQDPVACDQPMVWRLARLRASHAEARGHWVESRALQQRALQAAEQAGDSGAQAWSQSNLAVLSQVLGEAENARSQQAQAERLAQREMATGPLVRVRINAARLALLQGDAAGALQAMESALALLPATDRPRLRAVVRANLSDLWRQAGRLREALSAAEQALPVIRSFGDRHAEAPLLFNGGLARLALGQGRQARAEMDAALSLWQAAGAHGPLRQALREYADALAQVGDARAALALMQRERSLGEQMEQATRDAVLAELRQNRQAEQERNVFEQLTRDNALKAARLANQQWSQRTRLVAGLLLLLVAAMLGWQIWRNRRVNQQLRSGAEQLRLQNRSDPLTGLTNRRHGREWLAGWDARQPWGLLLLDVDHFKRINDEQGHHAGDLVLAEVARRLAAGVREGDLVCRWGGEEFLVAAPGLVGAELDTLARRLLAQVADTPVALPGGLALPVTLSMGLAAFPLPGEAPALAADVALERVDLALYAAKAQGRDRAVRLLAVQAESPAQRALLSGSFELAWSQGLVRLSTLPRR